MAGVIFVFKFPCLLLCRMMFFLLSMKSYM